MDTNPVPIPAVSTSRTKITDINIDCLEKICNFLSFEDLLNIADTNKHLKQAADLVYTLKYGNSLVYIPTLRKILDVHHNNCNTLIMYSLKTVLQALRCFGHIISLLNISPLTKIDASFAFVMEYVGEYCANQLKELKFCVPTENALHLLKKPLLKVQKLDIEQMNGVSINLINQLFPNLISLSISYGHHLIQNGKCTAVDFENIEKYFSNQMEIVVGPPGRYSTSTYSKHENIFDAVKLKRTKHGNDISMDMLPPLRQLEEFSVEISFKNEDDVYDLFGRYPSIQKLKLTPHFYCNHNFVESDLNVEKIANAFPWLTKIDLGVFKFTPDAVVNWIGQFNSMRKFKFYVEKQSEYIHLQNCLSNEWQCSSTLDSDKYLCNLIRNDLQLEKRSTSNSLN